MEPSWISAIAAVAGVAVTASRVAWSAAEFRVNSRNSSRPYVSVSFAPLERDDRIYFKVGNFGASVASNVTISFDDGLSAAEPSLVDFGAHIRRMYQSPGITLSPGEFNMSIYQDSPNSRKPGEIVAPERISGTIEYTGPATFSRKGRLKRKGARFVEEFALDAGPIKNLVRVSRSDHDIEQRLKTIATSIDRGVSKVDRAISELPFDNQRSFRPTPNSGDRASEDGCV